MSQNEGHSDLIPPVAKTLMTLLGTPLARKFIETFGGKTIHVSKGGMRAHKWRAIFEGVVGTEASNAIFKHFGGTDLYVPMCHRLAVQARNSQVAADYDSGMRANAIARKYGISDRYVYLILKRVV